jgi:Ca2+-binding EF-hand superfamily protein
MQDILNDETKFNQVAQMAFDAVDVDKSGQIDSTELHTALTEMAKDLGFDAPSADEVKAVLGELDSDNSGKLSFDEFKTFIRKVLESL